MSLKLDDLLLKKKEPVQVLDLSKCTANTKEEFKRLLEKVPEYKIKMEKIRPEDLHLKEKFRFNAQKKDLKPTRYPFANPIPAEMRSLPIEYLASVDIQWKMLTLQRPKNKMEEEYFTRLVELGKYTAATRASEKHKPNSKFLKTIRRYTGVKEIRILSCSNCGEEFCNGEACRDYLYESHQRINENLISSANKSDNQNTTAKKKKRKKSKIKKIITKKLKIKKTTITKKKSSAKKSKSVTNKNRKNSIGIKKGKNVKRIQNSKKFSRIDRKKNNKKIGNFKNQYRSKKLPKIFKINSNNYSKTNVKSKFNAIGLGMQQLSIADKS